MAQVYRGFHSRGRDERVGIDANESLCYMKVQVAKAYYIVYIRQSRYCAWTGFLLHYYYLVPTYLGDPEVKAKEEGATDGTGKHVPLPSSRVYSNYNKRYSYERVQLLMIYRELPQALLHGLIS